RDALPGRLYLALQEKAVAEGLIQLCNGGLREANPPIRINLFYWLFKTLTERHYSWFGIAAFYTI
ncbi:MAG: hypothetical protein AAB332_06280, partial [Planctomycetota bacterium]